MQVKLLSYSKDYLETLIKAIAKCHNKPLHQPVRTIDNIISAGHLSILEHCMASFEVTCSYSVLLQLSRHRHLSLTVQSSRVCKDFELYSTNDDAIDAINIDQLNAYEDIIRGGASNDNASYMLPRATEVNLVVSGNFRAWFEYLPKRLCKRALDEHREMAADIASLLAYKVPEVFNRTLVACHKCTERSCNFK